MRKTFWPILIACTLWRSAGAQTAVAGPRQPRLLSEVTLQTESIKLSDLLPPDADPLVRSAANHVSFGRGPEPGSVRVFTLEELQAQIEGKVRVDLPHQVVIRGAGFPVSRKRVQDAAQSLLGEVDWSQARIVIPTGFATRKRDMELRATRIRPGSNPRNVMMRLECRERRDCAPFWADVTFSAPEEARLRSRPGVPIVKQLDSRPPALVRPGHSAVLLCNNAKLRMSMRVLPLKRAGLGDAVQVFDPVTRHRFLARVSGPDLVESGLREAK